MTICGIVCVPVLGTTLDQCGPVEDTECTYQNGLHCKYVEGHTPAMCKKHRPTNDAHCSGMMRDNDGVTHVAHTNAPDAFPCAGIFAFGRLAGWHNDETFACKPGHMASHD